MLDFVYGLLMLWLVFAYAWTFYNLPVLAAGVRALRRNKQRPQRRSSGEKDRLVFSIVVPVKNEEKVIGRLLSALEKLRYPKASLEVVLVEDGSTDRTADICREFADSHDMKLKILHKRFSNGKPSALNYGVKQAEGDIVAVFDADSVPAPDALHNVSRYFEDSRVAAVQGRTLSINSEENMLSKFVSYEDAVWCEAYLNGKDALNMFVHLKGSCQFIRRDVLEKLGGFDDEFLSEDMELSARLVENGFKIRYASDVRSWQEAPSCLRQLFRQRTRWYRGTMEVAFKYGRLMAKPSRLKLDAEATLVGPFMLTFSIITYLSALSTAYMPIGLDGFWRLVMQLSGLGMTLLVFLCGTALIYASKPRRLRNILWLPFVYFYWSLQTFVAWYALLLIVLRRPRKWLKTEKRGTIAKPSTPGLES